MEQEKEPEAESVFSAALTQNRTGRTESDIIRRSERADWFRQTANRFIAASKKKFEDPAERKAWSDANTVILATLQSSGFSPEQMEFAERWIMFGDPCKYRDFTLQDFFPTKEQLESVGIDLGLLIESAEIRGEKRGIEIAHTAAFREWEDEVKELRRVDCRHRRTCERYAAHPDDGGECLKIFETREKV